MDFLQKNPQCGFVLQINPQTQKPTGQPSKCRLNRNITLGRIYVYLTMYNFNIFQYYVVLALQSHMFWTTIGMGFAFPPHLRILLRVLSWPEQKTKTRSQMGLSWGTRYFYFLLEIETQHLLLKIYITFRLWGKKHARMNSVVSTVHER